MLTLFQWSYCFLFHDLTKTTPPGCISLPNGSIFCLGGVGGLDLVLSAEWVPLKSFPVLLWIIPLRFLLCHGVSLL